MYGKCRKYNPILFIKAIYCERLLKTLFPYCLKFDFTLMFLIFSFMSIILQKISDQIYRHT